MADYYHNAVVTTVASASPGSSQSFLDIARYRKFRESVEIVRQDGEFFIPAIYVRLQEQTLYEHS
jgi:hypothetical protein